MNPENFEEILQMALSKPFAVFIRNDANNFKDSQNVFYEIGIQQLFPRPSKRFFNLFRTNQYTENEVSGMYFKHNPENIQELYEQFDSIKPSEISSKYWSKIIFSENINLQLVNELLNTSYDLILKGLPKVQQKLIQVKQSEKNNFNKFHNSCLKLTEKQDGLYLTYNDRPQLIYNGIHVFRFEENKLKFLNKFYSSSEDWETIILTAIKKQ